MKSIISRLLLSFLAFNLFLLVIVSGDALAQNNDFAIVGVTVESPQNQVVQPDEAIQIEGAIRVSGTVPSAGASVEAEVLVGYTINMVAWDPFQNKFINFSGFVVVHPVAVSGNIPGGTYGGTGGRAEFSEWCIANPLWVANRIYLCKGNPRDEPTDSIGSFAVGVSPSDLLLQWISWLLV